MNTHPIMRIGDMPKKFLNDVYLSGGVVCGGFARHLASSNLDSVANDIDIYPMDLTALRLLLSLFNTYSIEGGWGNLAAPTNYHGVSASNTVITHNRFHIRVQLVHMPMPPKEVINTFDFTVCQAYLDLYNQKIVTPSYWKLHEDARLLRLGTIKREYLSYRLIKYMKKGYAPDYDTIMTFMANIESSPNKIGSPDAKELALWLSLVHELLDKDTASLRDQISVLGQLMDNDSFQGKDDLLW